MISVILSILTAAILTTVASAAELSPAASPAGGPSVCGGLLDEDVSQPAFLISLLRTALERMGPPAPADFQSVHQQLKESRGNIPIPDYTLRQALSHVLRSRLKYGEEHTVSHRTGAYVDKQKILDLSRAGVRLVSENRTRFNMTSVDMVKEQIVGEPAIRAFLVGVLQNARATEAKLRAGARRSDPHHIRLADLWTQVGALGFLTSVAAWEGWVAMNAFAQGHNVTGAAMTAFALTLIARPIKVVFNRIYLAGKQALVNRGWLNQAMTPLAQAQAQTKFANDILRTLDRGEDLGDLIMYQGFTVKTPLRFSDYTRSISRRLAPTPAEIQTAYTELDGTRLPLDYREVTAHQIFRFDKKLRQPVLVLKVNELKPLHAW